MHVQYLAIVYMSVLLAGYTSPHNTDSICKLICTTFCCAPMQWSYASRLSRTSTAKAPIAKDPIDPLLLRSLVIKVRSLAITCPACEHCSRCTQPDLLYTCMFDRHCVST